MHAESESTQDESSGDDHDLNTIEADKLMMILSGTSEIDKRLLAIYKLSQKARKAKEKPVEKASSAQPAKLGKKPP